MTEVNLTSKLWHWRGATVSILLVMSMQAGAVEEIPDPTLGDIAIVRLNASGQPEIRYNPQICDRAGLLLCRFYRAHEYGHIAMGHAYSRTLPQQREAEADCWAAKNAPPAEVREALRWFSRGGGTSWHHGTGAQRAARVRSCFDARGGGAADSDPPGKSGPEDFQCLRECRATASSCRRDNVREGIDCRQSCRGGSQGFSECLADCRSSGTEGRERCAGELKDCQATCRD